MVELPGSIERSIEFSLSASAKLTCRLSLFFQYQQSRSRSRDLPQPIQKEPRLLLDFYFPYSSTTIGHDFFWRIAQKEKRQRNQKVCDPSHVYEVEDEDTRENESQWLLTAPLHTISAYARVDALLKGGRHENGATCSDTGDCRPKA